MTDFAKLIPRGCMADPVMLRPPSQATNADTTTNWAVSLKAEITVKMELYSIDNQSKSKFILTFLPT